MLRSYRGAIEIGVHRQALYKFNSATKCDTNLADMIPQRRQVLYKNSLEYHNIGFMQFKRAQHPFQDLSEDQLTIDFKLPGLIRGL